MYCTARGTTADRGLSKVTEGNDDSLFKKPWKQGLFASTFCTKRRGRDSNPRSSF